MTECRGADESDKTLSGEMRKAFQQPLRLPGSGGHPLAGGQRHLESTNPHVNKHSTEMFPWTRAALPYLCEHWKHASSYVHKIVHGKDQPLT